MFTDKQKIQKYFDYIKIRQDAMEARFSLSKSSNTQNQYNFHTNLSKGNLYLVQKEDFGKQPFYDEIVDKYQFTNNYRELDAGTTFVISYISRANKDANPYSIVFSSILYRWFNLPYTYMLFYSATKDIGDSTLISPRLFIKNFDNYSEEFLHTRASIFSRAYLISARYGPKWWYNMKERLLPLAKHPDVFLKPIIEAKSGKEAFDRIFRLPHTGGGGFIAYEIYSDIIYSGIWPWSENEYFNVGPGAERGIDDIFGPYYNTMDSINNTETDIKTKTDLYVYYLHYLWQHQDEYLDKSDFHRFLGRKLSKRNIEHTLCEFHKYNRRKMSLQNHIKHHGERYFTHKSSSINITKVDEMYNEWREKFREEFHY